MFHASSRFTSELMAGIEIVDREGKPATDYVIRVIQKLLKMGLIFLPEGAESNVISFTPPLTITRAQLKKAVLMLQVVLFSEKP